MFNSADNGRDPYTGEPYVSDDPDGAVAEEGSWNHARSGLIVVLDVFEDLFDTMVNINDNNI